VQRLEQLADVRYPESVVAEAANEPARDSARTVKRAATLALFPRFVKALEAGEIHPAHVDSLTNALANLPEAKQAGLVGDEDRLLDLACRRSPRRFDAAVRDKVHQLLSAEEATAQLARQRQAASLTLWIDKSTGMLRLRGQFDPERGSELIARIEAARQQLFPDPQQLPEGCPTDPSERDDHLRALALVQLLLDDAAPGWRPEVLLVVDEPTVDGGFHDRSIIDVGVDVELPIEAIRRLAQRGRQVRVTMRDGVVTSVNARTNLNRGRTKRLADVDQRRALRAMYPTCAVPDCPVRYRDCEIHHLHDWDHGGPTNIDRLLPLCDCHHDAIHHRGMILELHPITRLLTVTYPDGTTTVTPPPYAFAA